MKTMIPQLGRYKALLKIPESPFPYQIITFKSKVQRHIGDEELNMLMKEKISRLNSLLDGGQSVKRARVISCRATTENNVSNKEAVSKVTSEVTNPLDDIDHLLKFINSNPVLKLTDVYRALKLSGRKGNSLKKKALDNGLIVEEIRRSGRKGRPIKALKLTEEGTEYINAK